MSLPTLDEINSLHKKYAPNKDALHSVWTHCHIVRRLSLDIADNWYPTNKSLIEAGALLHDIGVYRLYKNNVLDEANYITHGLLGYELLKKEGIDEELCRFALLHTGVGITKNDIQKDHLPLPMRDYVAETDEEKIVMYADKFHSKTQPPMLNTAEWYINYLESKFGADKSEAFKFLIEEFGEPNLQPLISRYGHSVR